MYEEKVNALIEPLKNTPIQRLTINEYLDQDEKDSAIVMSMLDKYAERMVPIVRQLEAYTRKTFTLTTAQNNVRAQSKANGIIEVDYATLNKSEEELAFTLAHEWGHHDLAHQYNAHAKKTIAISMTEAEHSADFYAGVFLGYHNYDLKKLLEYKLSLPDGTSCHGTRDERAKIIANGFVLGKEMLEGNINLGFVPAYVAYVNNTGHSPWKQKEPSAYSEVVLSKLRNESR